MELPLLRADIGMDVGLAERLSACLQGDQRRRLEDLESWRERRAREIVESRLSVTAPGEASSLRRGLELAQIVVARRAGRDIARSTRTSSNQWQDMPIQAVVVVEPPPVPAALAADITDWWSMILAPLEPWPGLIPVGDTRNDPGAWALAARSASMRLQAARAMGWPTVRCAAWYSRTGGPPVPRSLYLRQVVRALTSVSAIATSCQDQMVSSVGDRLAGDMAQFCGLTRESVLIALGAWSMSRRRDVEALARLDDNVIDVLPLYDGLVSGLILIG
ncbi:MAG: hypothetical protein ACYDAG_19095, partial [Chloroflexota bacterium]